MTQKDEQPRLYVHTFQVLERSSPPSPFTRENCLCLLLIYLSVFMQDLFHGGGEEKMPTASCQVLAR